MQRSIINNDAKYDILKLILSAMVVAIHSNLYPVLLFPWLRIAVPMFFMISAYFLFSRLRNSTMVESRKVIKKFVCRNVKLYLFWFVVLLPLTLYNQKHVCFSGNIWKESVVFLRNLFLGSTFTASWYITASVIGTLIIWNLCKRGKRWIVLLLCTTVFCMVTLWSSYSSLLEKNTFITIIMREYDRFFGTPVLSFPASLFWIFMGKCFAEEKIKPFSWTVTVVFIILSSVLLYLEWQFVRKLDGSLKNDSYFMLAPLCLCIFMSVQKLRPISYRYAVHLRHISTVTYVVHPALLRIIGYIYRKIFHIDSVLTLYFTVLLVSILIYLVIIILLRFCYSNKIIRLLKYAY